MRTRSVVNAVLAVVLLAGWSAGANPTSTSQKAPSAGKVVTNVVHVKAKVVSINYEKRTLALQGPNGTVEEFTVDPAVKRFKAIKKGDEVSIDYLESVAIRVQAPGEAKAPTASGSYVVVNEGRKPSGTVVKSHQVAATVEKVDQKKQEVVLKGPHGTQETVRVSQPATLNQLKEGDRVVVQLTRAVAISVKEAA